MKIEFYKLTSRNRIFGFIDSWHKKLDQGIHQKNRQRILQRVLKSWSIFWVSLVLWVFLGQKGNSTRTSFVNSNKRTRNFRYLNDKLSHSIKNSSLKEFLAENPVKEKGSKPIPKVRKGQVNEKVLWTTSFSFSYFIERITSLFFIEYD